jgi:hypothetical protein
MASHDALDGKAALEPRFDYGFPLKVCHSDTLRRVCEFYNIISLNTLED